MIIKLGDLKDKIIQKIFMNQIALIAQEMGLVSLSVMDVKFKITEVSYT